MACMACSHPFEHFERLKDTGLLFMCMARFILYLVAERAAAWTFRDRQQHMRRHAMRVPSITGPTAARRKKTAFLHGLLLCW